MNIVFNKDKFKAIEGAFDVHIESYKNGSSNSQAANKIIIDTLEEVFKGYKFIVNIIDDTKNKTDNTYFCMSVFPEYSTLDKIIFAIASNKEDKLVSDLWKKNTTWTIEIDSKILNGDFTSRELTALLLHEIGHISSSNAITNRINTILRYEIAKNGSKIKSLFSCRLQLFRSIMSLPVLDACVSDKKKSLYDLKEEIKADNFAKKFGYQNELYSSLTKVQKVLSRGTSSDTEMSNSADFVSKTLYEIKERRDKLAKKSLLQLKEECASPYIEHVIDDFLTKVYASEDTYLQGKNKVEFIQEKMDDIEDEYITEFFLLGGKKLKRIDPAELDYVQVTIPTIKNSSDKMLLISYIYNKLDMIDYYISILANPKLARKYNIPHTMEQLEAYKSRLLAYRDNVLKYKIPDKNKNVLVAWPTGYEG